MKQEDKMTETIYCDGCKFWKPDETDVLGIVGVFGECCHFDTITHTAHDNWCEAAKGKDETKQTKEVKIGREYH